jgi:hypothetical protein
LQEVIRLLPIDSDGNILHSTLAGVWSCQQLCSSQVYFCPSCHLINMKYLDYIKLTSRNLQWVECLSCEWCAQKWLILWTKSLISFISNPNFLGHDVSWHSSDKANKNVGSVLIQAATSL